MAASMTSLLPSQSAPAALVSFGRPPTLCLPPDRYSSPNANQHPRARILVSLLLVLILCKSWSHLPGWVRKKPMAFSSSPPQHSATSKAAPARTLHAPFSSSLDRIGQPSGYAYLESASSEGSINTRHPLLSAFSSSCYFGTRLGLLHDGLPIVPQSALSTTSQQPGCGIVSCCCAACLSDSITRRYIRFRDF
jgi:hypothetical protein